MTAVGFEPGTLQILILYTKYSIGFVFKRVRVINIDTTNMNVHVVLGSVIERRVLFMHDICLMSRYLRAICRKGIR